MNRFAIQLKDTKGNVKRLVIDNPISINFSSSSEGYGFDDKESFNSIFIGVPKVPKSLYDLFPDETEEFELYQTNKVDFNVDKYNKAFVRIEIKSGDKRWRNPFNFSIYQTM